MRSVCCRARWPRGEMIANANVSLGRDGMMMTAMRDAADAREFRATAYLRQCTRYATVAARGDFRDCLGVAWRTREGIGGGKPPPGRPLQCPRAQGHGGGLRIVCAASLMRLSAVAVRLPCIAQQPQQPLQQQYKRRHLQWHPARAGGEGTCVFVQPRTVLSPSQLAAHDRLCRIPMACARPILTAPRRRHPPPIPAGPVTFFVTGPSLSDGPATARQRRRQSGGVLCWAVNDRRGTTKGKRGHGARASLGRPLVARTCQWPA